ncbi:MAG: response regulator [Deltaproteobacteria bacterium]|nr:response regulator [Deltaproteobacteria bacterium]
MEIICELVPGLGETLVASRRSLVTALMRAMRKALAWKDTREIRVRLARQCAGLATSDVVLLTVSGERHGQLVHVELSMPLAAEVPNERVADGARLLVIAPSSEAARVVIGGARRAGAAAHAVVDADQARSELRAARAGGRTYDIVFVDEAHPASAAFIDALREDVTLGGPPSLVAAIGSEASERDAWRARGATAILEKPVLPSQLGSTIASVLMRGGGRGASRLPSGRLRVLLGEDEPTVARMTVRMIERMGHEVVVEASGRVVLQRLGSEAFDVLILDVGLDDIDGLTVARMVREERTSGAEGPSMVIIASANRLPPEVAAAAGVDVVLEKPLDAKKLGAHLPAALRQGEPASGEGEDRRARDSSTRLVAHSRGTTSADRHAVEKAPVLDLAELLARAGGDAELVRELLADFLTHSAGWSATLREACESGAFTEAGRLAHRLRGALSGLSARSAALAAEAVEHHLAAGVGGVGSEVRAKLALALPDLERRLEHVRAAARAHLEGPPRASSDR